MLCNTVILSMNNRADVAVIYVMNLVCSVMVLVLTSLLRTVLLCDDFRFSGLRYNYHYTLNVRYGIVLPFRVLCLWYFV